MPNEARAYQILTRLCAACGRNEGLGEFILSKPTSAHKRNITRNSTSKEETNYNENQTFDKASLEQTKQPFSKASRLLASFFDAPLSFDSRCCLGGDGVFCGWGNN